MPDPQDTGAQPAAASNLNTGVPPGGSGGGTADPHQIVPPGQTDHPDDIQEYEDPYNPLEHQLEESEWDFDHDEQEIDLGDDNPNKDEDSDPGSWPRITRTTKRANCSFVGSTVCCPTLPSRRKPLRSQTKSKNLSIQRSRSSTTTRHSPTTDADLEC